MQTRLRILFVLLCLGLPGWPPQNAIADEFEFNVGGQLRTDLRFRVEERGVGGWYNRQTLNQGISRNENVFKLKLEAEHGMFRGVAEVDLVFFGKMDTPEGLSTLSVRESLDPYRLEAHALFIEAMDLLPGLDLRIGYQIVNWGQGDQFNPTNNLNANDIEDPLLFGDRQANLMLRLDYTFAEEWSLSGVLVPIFRPALLPESGALALSAIDRIPFNNDDLRHLLHAQAAFSKINDGLPTVVANAIPEVPEITPENMQFAFRLAGVLGDQDIALSYYFGRNDIPVPHMNYNRIVPGERCKFAPVPPYGNPSGPMGNPDQYAITDVNGDGIPDDPDCIRGEIQTTSYLHYPRMQVLGFNMAGEIPVIGVGYRLELGIYFPERQTVKIIKDKSLGLGSPEKGFDPAFNAHPEADYLEYDYDFDGVPGGPEPEVVASTPFAKWSLGLDYTIAEIVYINLQWVHGMVDEFGAGDWITEGYTVRKGSAGTDKALLSQCTIPEKGAGARCASEIYRPRLGDYLVLGADFRFANGDGLFRLFTVFDLSGYIEEHWDEASETRVTTSYPSYTKEGFGMVILPELRYNFGHGMEMHLGGLVQLGRQYTKFGDAAAGGSQVYMRAKYSF